MCTSHRLCCFIFSLSLLLLLKFNSFDFAVFSYLFVLFDKSDNNSFIIFGFLHSLILYCIILRNYYILPIF